MAYAKGITKIHSDPTGLRDFKSMCAWAAVNQFDAITFNGEIYISTPGEYVSRKYVKTPFKLTDFEV